MPEEEKESGADVSLCGACGRPHGQGKDCEECLRRVIERDAEKINDQKAKEAKVKADKWLKSHGKSAPAKLLNGVKLLAAIMRDYFKGDYKQVPWTTITLVAAAILYIVNPFDIVPDFIPGIGWLDDIVVLHFVLKAVAGDLKKYVEYKGLSPEDYGL